MGLGEPRYARCSPSARFPCLPTRRWECGFPSFPHAGFSRGPSLAESGALRTRVAPQDVFALLWKPALKASRTGFRHLRTTAMRALARAGAYCQGSVMDELLDVLHPAVGAKRRSCITTNTRPEEEEEEKERERESPSREDKLGLAIALGYADSRRWDILESQLNQRRSHRYRGATVSEDRPFRRLVCAQGGLQVPRKVPPPWRCRGRHEVCARERLTLRTMARIGTLRTHMSYIVTWR